MKTDIQYPQAHVIPEGKGDVLASQTNPTYIDIEDALIIAAVPVDFELRRRILYGLGYPIPEQSSEELALVRGAVIARQKRLNAREKASTRQAAYEDRKRGGKPKRKYTKRK